MVKLVSNPEVRHVFWPEQTLVPLMQHILRKYTRSDALVFYPYLSTNATAKFFHTVKHCMVTGRDGDGTYVEKMMPSLVETIVGQILNKDSEND